MSALVMLPPAVRKRMRWLSLTPFDQGTPEGRANERHRRMALTAAASALAKMLTVGSALVSVPLTLGYLGRERFGMWMTISSLIAMLAFADFGIANGVLNTVSSAHGRDDDQAIRRAISSGFFLLSAIGATLLLAFAAIYAYVPWASFFNVTTPQAAAEAGPALAVFVCCFAANIPLALVQRAQIGLQKGFIASLWQCAGSICGLLGVLWAIHAQASLQGLVLAMAGVPVLSAILNSLHFFLRARPDLLPRRAHVSARQCQQLGATGSLFFVLQIVVAVAYSSDSFIIAQLKGAGAVADYAVPEKLFSLVPLIMTMVLMPLWPAYGEAIARGDIAWVRITLKRSITLAVASATILVVLLVLLAPQILRWWVGSAIVPPLLLLIAFGVWKVVEAAGNASAMFLNGSGVVRLQVWCAICTAVAAVSLKLTLVPLVGLSGVIWASIISYLICTALPIGLKLPALLRRHEVRP